MTVLPGLARERTLDEERDLWRVLLVARGRRLEEERQPLAAQRLGRLAREQREHVIDRVGRRHLLAFCGGEFLRRSFIRT